MGWGKSKEQRRTRRLGASLPLRYSLVVSAGGDARPVSALTTTVSYGGLSFVTPVSLPIHTRLAIDLSVPDEAADVRLEGTVVRIVSDHPQGEGVEYGVEFSGSLMPEVIAKYLRSIDIVPMLQAMAPRGASALHLSASAPPVYRVQRELAPEGAIALTPERVEGYILGALTQQQRRQLMRDKEIDFPLVIPEVGRWRANVHYVRGAIEAVFRAVSAYVPTISELGLPGSAHHLAMAESGLVIVTGPTGSGKTTTLAAMVGHINRESSKVIVTIEDPVEYVHESDRSIVKQREVGTDTTATVLGLKHALRQNPDVIVASDVRDRPSMELALRAAESGFLTLITMHTANALETIERIASLYPREERDVALQTLGACLRGVVAQRLFYSESGAALAVEIMVVNEGIRGAIKAGKLDQIGALLNSAPGSMPMDVSLRNLVVRGLISFEAAAMVSREPERLKKLLSEHRGQ